MDQEIVVGVLTCYGLGGQGFNLWWGKGIFPFPPPLRPELDSIQLPAVGTGPVTGE